MTTSLNIIPWVDLPKGYTLTANDICVDLLFERLIQNGVWDEKREAMLRPMIPDIKETWRCLKQRPDLFRVITCQNEDGSKWSHHVVVRITNNGNLLQSLVANCHEAPTAMVTYVLDSCRGHSVQTWYLPAEGDEQPGYSERMMGMGAMQRVHQYFSPELCDTVEHQYLFTDSVPSGKPQFPVSVVPVSNANYPEFLEFLRHNAGNVFVGCEEFDADDPFLEDLNQKYGQIGLSRKRNMYLAYIQNASAPVAVLIVNTGALGMNLRFLERRSQVFISKDLPDAYLGDLCAEILRTAAPHYDQLKPGFIPIVTDENGAKGMMQHGAVHHVRYHQHMTTAENSELVDYHLNLLRLRYEKMKKLMQSA